MNLDGGPLLDDCPCDHFRLADGDVNWEAAEKLGYRAGETKDVPLPEKVDNGRGVEMSDYRIDLDPVHTVLRLTITSEIMTLECAKEIHTRLTQLSSSGGPYAAIFDLTMTKHTTIPTEMVRTLARNRPSISAGRPHVIVGEAPVIFGLARLFEMCGEAVSKEHEVVHTLEEAYEIVEAAPEDFTERL